MDKEPGPTSLRLDKFLWFARIVKTRSLAQALVEQGRMRVNGRVVAQAHAPIRVGDVLSFALGGNVRLIRVERLPQRRGPPAEARLLYSNLSEGPLTREAQAD
jgi:ribosome-associated heat shock protein Hsp15